MCENNDAMHLIDDIIQNYNKSEKLTLKMVGNNLTKIQKLEKKVIEIKI